MPWAELLLPAENYHSFFSNLFLAGLGLRRCAWASRGYSLVVVRGLLVSVASLVAERGLQGTWASVGEAHGSVVAAPGL